MARFLAALFASVFMLSCSPSAKNNPSATIQEDRTISVVVTNSILADALANASNLSRFAQDGKVTSDSRVEITLLVGRDGDPHTYEPTPADIKAVADADIYLENGLGLEPWSEKLFQTSGSKALRVIAGNGIKPIRLEEDSHQHDHGDGHGNADFDPHVWNDVQNFIIISQTIRDALIQTDPARQKEYEGAFAAYSEKLRSLDDWVVAETNTLPREKRKLVTNHDVFAYFAKRYQFEVLGNAVGSLTTESHDPSAAHIAKLVREIKKTGVKTIFGDFNSNPKLIQQVAAEAGVRLGPKLYIDSLGLPGSAGGTYENMMRHNVASIVENLK